MKKENINEIQNISLSAKQIKSKLEASLAYDYEKFKDVEILFATKAYPHFKLPFSDFKISISDELTNQQVLIENLEKYVDLVEEKIEVEEFIPQTTIVDTDDESNVHIVEELDEDDEFIDQEEDGEEEDDELYHALLPYKDKAKRPKGYTIKVVDVEAIIRKIKAEGMEKNKGKPVIGRRQINKLLRPYILKNTKIENEGIEPVKQIKFIINEENNIMEIDGIETSTLTSIDMYLNAVDKIANTSNTPVNKNSNDSLELDLHKILKDLEK